MRATTDRATRRKDETPMRTVSEIIEAVQEQQPATEEELRLALLCCHYSLTLAQRYDFETASEMALRMGAKETFERNFRMMKSDPTVYLGANWTPGTSENKAQRDRSKRVLKAFEASKGKSQ